MDDLQTIPGVGKSIAVDLRDLGITRVADLRGRDPERLYARINAKRGVRQDPCLLYVFRCAVYYASSRRPKPELLKWWAWKDRRVRRGRQSVREAGTRAKLPRLAGRE
jgi:hypothetical protein